MTNILVTSIAKSTTLVINSKNDGDVLVVRSVKIVRGRPVYDLRQVSKQQQKLLDLDHATDMKELSAEFLTALLDHTVGAVHQRLVQLKG